MNTPDLPLGVPLSTGIEYRPAYPKPYRARVRWTDPATGQRASRSESFTLEDEAKAWIERILKSAARGVTAAAATMPLAEYGEAVWDLAMRGLQPKTLDPYSAGWRLRIVPTLGHLPTQGLTPGLADRAVTAWITAGAKQSTVRNTLAALSRIMDQAVRDGLIDTNPAHVTGWRQLYTQDADEDEADDPRSLALPDHPALKELAAALVDRSHNRYRGWGDVVEFAACTAARIGEVSGVRAQDIDTTTWTWNLRRQTTPSPGGLADKGTKGKRRRTVPIIPQLRPLVARRLAAAGTDPTARLFTGPRGGRITTAVLRDATHWDDVVTRLGHEHLRRHDLRHTGLTWMADAGIPLHVLREIAGHSSLTITQRYLHPDQRTIQNAGTALSHHLTPPPAQPTRIPAQQQRNHLRLVQ
ncbi:site-specific integrase [Yinghuangia sp. ASG 101]|uniref:site-specific integrase n=1 Tax=Yinghuangia sp. ASG 101 TaxID=2896848 RepID=UPI001E509CF1|nr:site-specific integrase [Yinghuangia sp. ASG 101]UGQ10900.1 site-specific integrase [Yinghuangia sp. ASG 101]